MTSTVDVSIWTSLPHTKVKIELKSGYVNRDTGPLYWLSIDSANIFVNAESAARIIEALRPLVPANYGIEPEELCEDEGCPHFGTPHGHNPASVVKLL